jgi:hypothetical protein
MVKLEGSGGGEGGGGSRKYFTRSLKKVRESVDSLTCGSFIHLLIVSTPLVKLKNIGKTLLFSSLLDSYIFQV